MNPIINFSTFSLKSVVTAKIQIPITMDASITGASDFIWVKKYVFVYKRNMYL